MNWRPYVLYAPDPQMERLQAMKSGGPPPQTGASQGDMMMQMQQNMWNMMQAQYQGQGQGQGQGSIVDL